MKQSEYKRMSAYFAVVHSIKTHIEQVEKLIMAIETRATNGGNLSLYVSLKEKGYRDQGAHVELPVYLAKEAVLPPLYKALKELRDEFRALPPADCKAAPKAVNVNQGRE
ncbi:MAG: hypothetical protein U1E51_06650 [Candidatus Binatia bacterium]|nr:hypothetical protein [Candidatus Binatia bacterium]